MLLLLAVHLRSHLTSFYSSLQFYLRKHMTAEGESSGYTNFGDAITHVRPRKCKIESKPSLRRMQQTCSNCFWITQGVPVNSFYCVNLMFSVQKQADTTLLHLSDVLAYGDTYCTDYVD
jgi:hypothetical protein